MRAITIPFAITKVDEDERRVWGVATSEDLDSQGDVLDYEASKKAVTDWMKIGNIREMHDGKKAVGKAFDVQFDDVNKSITVGSYISKSPDGEGTWQKVKEGILTGYSVGGSVAATVTEKAKDAVSGVERTINRVTDWAMSELSLVDNPANPSAQISMIKSKDGKSLDYIDVDAIVKAFDTKLNDALKKKASSIPTPWWVNQFQNESLTKKSIEQYNENQLEKMEKDGAISKQYLETIKSKGADMKKADKIRKDFFGAATLVDCAMTLTWFLQGEVAEGDTETATAVQKALDAIKEAAVSEINETPDEQIVSLANIIEYGMKTMDLAKKEGRIRKSGANVADGDPRDSTAATVTEVTPVVPVKGGTIVPKKVYAAKPGVYTNKADESTDLEKLETITEQPKPAKRAEDVDTDAENVDGAAAQDAKAPSGDDTNTGGGDAPTTPKAAEPAAQTSDTASDASTETSLDAPTEATDEDADDDTSKGYASTSTTGGEKNGIPQKTAPAGKPVADAAQPTDLMKSLTEVQNKLEKLEQGGELAKAVSDLGAMVKGSLDSFDQRLKKFEKTPQEIKTTVPYAEVHEVIKGQEQTVVDSKPTVDNKGFTDAEITEMRKRADYLAAHPGAGDAQERGQLMRKLWGVGAEQQEKHIIK